MFSIYPGFEELPIHVEVEWRGQKRMVIARFEQWPTSNRAILVCALQDETDAGEWVILRAGGTPYYVQETLRGSWGLDEEDDDEPWAPESSLDCDVTDEFARAIAGAFKNDLFQLARVFQLPWPHNSSIAALTKTRCAWHGDWDFMSPAVFDCRHDIMDLSESQTRAQIFSDWKNESGDVRFAWHWAGWDINERLRQLSGIPDYFAGLERLMRNILVASTRLWQDNSQLLWRFCAWAERGNLAEHQHQCFPVDLNDGISLVENHLHLWRPLLLKGYEPKWRDDWPEKYHCIGYTFGAKERASVEIQLNQPPSAHQQLEAKLQLREWLADAATLDVAAVLMASLNA